MHCIVYTVGKHDNINVSNRLRLIKEKRGFKSTSDTATRKYITEGCHYVGHYAGGKLLNWSRSHLMT